MTVRTTSPSQAGPAVPSAATTADTIGKVRSLCAVAMVPDPLDPCTTSPAAIYAYGDMVATAEEARGDSGVGVAVFSGVQPAGGIRTTKDAITYLVMVNEVAGQSRARRPDAVGRATPSTPRCGGPGDPRGGRGRRLKRVLRPTLAGYLAVEPDWSADPGLERLLAFRQTKTVWRPKGI